MTFNDDNNNYKLQNLRIVYNLQRSPISKSCPLFFYDALSLHSIYYYPTRRLLLFSSVESQGLQFSILCAHHCWEQLSPVDTFSGFFPALSLECFLPSLHVSEPNSTTWPPIGGQSYSLTCMSLASIVFFDSNLLVKPYYFPAPLLTNDSPSIDCVPTICQTHSCLCCRFRT